MSDQTTEKAGTIRVRVSVTIEVDAQAWADEYDVERSEVRADVKRWAVDRLNRYDDGIAHVIPPAGSAT